MVHEDQQKYTYSGTDGTGSCATSGGRVFSYQKSPQVHAAATACLPDCQRTTRSRLSWHSCYAQRVVRPASSPWPTIYSTFYNIVCSQQTAITKTNCRSFTAFDPATMSQDWTAKSSFQTSGHRLDRIGNPSCISLLYTSLQTPLRALQTTISKAFSYLRYIQSSAAGHDYRPRSKTRLCRRRINFIQCTFTAKIRDNFGRCRLRVRAFS